MRVLYTVLLILLAPLAFGWLALRARRQTGESDAGHERRGYLPSVPASPPIWLHAASLGEAQAASSLIDALLARDESLLITTFSATARHYCRKRYGRRAVVTALPYDLPLFVNRFLRAARPRMAIFLETELWPNLYHALAERRVPIIIVSARMSAQAFRRYSRFRQLVGANLKQVAHVGAQTQVDADRFRALGAPEPRVSVMGNLKFDTQVPPDLAQRGARLRRDLFGQRPVWVAGSTREGEDETILAAFKIVAKQVPDCTLVLAPRHPERVSAIAEAASAAGLDTALRSSDRQPCEAPVLIVDGVGELNDFYAASDVVFVGGTLVDIGGHNILEPAMLGKPIITGPYLTSWQALADEMSTSGALTVASGLADLANIVTGLLFNADTRKRGGELGRAAVERNRGALNRALALIDKM